ncbi:MAG: hypothetical protein MUE85_04965 [Microscillaceae bacterium]|jgi:uncharacterized membrane protein YphA (DoxX/SURF4 family)|nr:hypothetical protein [Microscillaceae bacterium]
MMRNLYLSIVRLLLVFLFVYAAISKLAVVDLFQSQMYESPLLPQYFVPFLAYFVPILELGIALFLVSGQNLLNGLYASFGIMLMFTLYMIGLISIFTDKIPCACGGILGKLGYTEHIIFNIIFTLLALLAIFVHTSKNKSKT